MKASRAKNFEDIAHGLQTLEVAPDAPSLAGRRAWVLSDGVAGHLAIAKGVTETLGLDAETKLLTPRSPWRHLAPFGPPDPRLMRELLAKPLPDIVLGAGRQTAPFVRALKKAGVFTVIFQSPRASLSCAHLIWAPAHDGLKGANVISTLTPPHRYSERVLTTLRLASSPAIIALPQPRITLLLGGPGAGYEYDTDSIADFNARLINLAPYAGSFLITPSRRTPQALLAAADSSTAEKPRMMWRGDGKNLYPEFLAHADAIIVTADSVNMTGEACSTGKPVYVFSPRGGRAKFRRFHAALNEHGATRPLPAQGALESWTYEPLRAAEHVAAEIETRWRAFRSTKPHG